MKKLFIVIPTNRCISLPKQTVAVIENTKTPTIFVKQSLPRFYKNHPYITEIISQDRGASNARNLGIDYAFKHSADLIAFIDDDCLITKQWITSLRRNQHSVVFGRTLPFNPQHHLNEYCPCTFTPELKVIRTINLPRQLFGYSNNFAVTTSALKKIGNFNPHLGVGTPSLGGEDDDFIIRTLNLKFPIYFQSKMVLYHNKWITLQQLTSTFRQYTFSFGVVYMWHSLHRSRDCQKVLFKELLLVISRIILCFRYITNPKRAFELAYEQINQLFALISGMFFAFSL